MAARARILDRLRRQRCTTLPQQFALHQTTATIYNNIITTCPTNAYGAALLKYVDKAINSDSFAGIYMDESAYITSPLDVDITTIE